MRPVNLIKVDGVIYVVNGCIEECKDGRRYKWKANCDGLIQYFLTEDEAARWILKNRQ